MQNDVISIIALGVIYLLIGFLMGYRIATRKSNKRPKLTIIKGGKKSVETKFPF